jgi:hypothetical protein
MDKYVAVDSRGKICWVCDLKGLFDYIEFEDGTKLIDKNYINKIEVKDGV